MKREQSDRRTTQLDDEFIMEDLQQMQVAGNYNAWLHSLIKPFIGKEVLEVGAGIGNLSKLILDDAEHFTAVEPNLACQRILIKSFKENPSFQLIPESIEKYLSSSESKIGFDTIICINVLEHIIDDQKIINGFADSLNKAGNLVVIVPAVQWAYGSMDKAVGHYRRYSKKYLVNIFRKSSLDLNKIYFLNFPGLLGWIFNSRIFHIQAQKQSQITLFDHLVPIIRKIEGIIHPPVGMSLFAVGRKNG